LLRSKRPDRLAPVRGNAKLSVLEDPEVGCSFLRKVEVAKRREGNVMREMLFT